MKASRLLLLLPLLYLVASVAAQAHAFLDYARPRVGSAGPAPDQVQLFMTREVNAQLSKVRVFNARNEEVDKKDCRVTGDTMTVSLPHLEAGVYLVKWRAIARDTHETSGSFEFTVQ